MGFVKTGWSSPLVQERALREAYLAELESVGGRQTAELAALISRQERERALCVARYGVAHDRLWREWAGVDDLPGKRTPGREYEQRREPS